VYTGFTASGDLVQLTISGTSRAARAIITSGTYELKINGTLASSGAVSPGASGTLTFTPASGKPPFTANVSGGVPAFTGQIELDTGTKITVEPLTETPVTEDGAEAQLAWLGNAPYTIPAATVYIMQSDTLVPFSTAATVQCFYNDQKDLSASTEQFLSGTISASGDLSLILTLPDWDKVAAYTNEHIDLLRQATVAPANAKIITIGNEYIYTSGASITGWKQLAQKRAGELHGLDAIGGGWVEYWYSDRNAVVAGTANMDNPWIAEYNVVLKEGWNSVLVINGSYSIRFISGVPGSEYTWEVYKGSGGF
jgi:hypothetical protein